MLIDAYINMVMWYVIHFFSVILYVVLIRFDFMRFNLVFCYERLLGTNELKSNPGSNENVGKTQEEREESTRHRWRRLGNHYMDRNTCQKHRLTKVCGRKKTEGCSTQERSRS